MTWHYDVAIVGEAPELAARLASSGWSVVIASTEGAEGAEGTERTEGAAGVECSGALRVSRIERTAHRFVLRLRNGWRVHVRALLLGTGDGRVMISVATGDDASRPDSAFPAAGRTIGG